MSVTVTEIKVSGPKKTPQEMEVERLMTLTPTELNGEDLRVIQRIHDARNSLLIVEEQLEELKEVRKLRQQTLDAAILSASKHFECRQLALNFG